ncbi:MAG TPA: Ig-like domain-containing protein, partial [Acidimicrobiia bacterium]|nr:Ig-like domain-containing protein [Acidimicrobiia bacterium]
TPTDIDSTNLTGATVTIAANFAPGEDVLSFTNQLGISASYVAGTMTLTGTATVADYETALRSITYSNTSEDPSPAPRTLAFVVSDASNPSVVATRSLTVAAANDTPTATTTGGSASYTENASAVVLDAGFGAADVDNTNLAGASLQITGNFASGEDALAFTNQSGISGSWNAGSGLLTLSGSASVADYQAAIRIITYVDTSDDPLTATRTVTITVTDGTATSAPATRDVDVTAVNDAPAITPTGSSLSFTENAAATAVDGALTVGDLDDASLTAATVAISSGYWNGEDELAFTDQSGITGSWDATSGALTLTGSATVAQYQTALRTVTYVDTSDDPHAVARTVTFTVTDSALTSSPVTRSIDVVPVNDLPYASLATGSVTYVEDDAPVAIDSTATVTDPDDSTLPSATVAVTSGYHNGQDVLAVTGGGAGIAASWDSATGTLALHGAASPAGYQSVLRSVVFSNTSQHPTSGARVLTVTLADASGPGGSVTRTVVVSAVDDAPVAVDDSDTTFEAVGITVDVLENDTDIEDDQLSIAAVDVPAHATATVTSDQKLHVAPDADFAGSMSVDYTVSDGSATDTGTLTLTVLRVADMGVDLTAAPNPVTVGDDILVDIGVGNAGPGIAVHPVAYFDTGAGHRITSVRSDDGTCGAVGAQGRCDFVDIAAGDTVHVTVAVRTGGAGTLTAGAIVTAEPLDFHVADNGDEAELIVRSRTRSSAPRSPATTTTVPQESSSTTSSTSSASSATTTTTTTTHHASTTTTTRPVTPTTHADAPPTTIAETDEKSEGGRSGVGLYVGVLVTIAAAIAAAVVLIQRRVGS